jgi:phenylalanyl-tRNA synthetase beta chain
VTVEPSVDKIRPFVVAAILRNITFTQDAYNSFIDLQDKLHHNLGRRRTLVSMGTHDFDKIKGPFRYVAKPADQFRFVALNKTEAYNGEELLKIFEKDLQLKNYVPIIQHSDVIPLIMDAEDRVLSMPPIINSEFSKIGLDTRNVFIEITATDRTKALMALNVLVATFSQFCEDKFSFEQVEIRRGDKVIDVTPTTPLIHTLRVSKDYLETTVGMSVSDDDVLNNLSKMGLGVTKHPSKPVFDVEVPFYRTDVMHPCDIAEDLAIAIGYNKVPFLDPDVVGAGRQDPLNKMTELTRHELATAGFSECLNFALCSVEDLTTRLLRKTDPRMVEIANPKTADFQVGRTTLLTGMIKSIVSNKSHELPLQLFEVSDVVLTSKDKITQKDKSIFANIAEFFSPHETIGAINERRLCLVYSNSHTSGLDLLHGTLDLLFAKLFGNTVSYALRDNDAPYLFLKLQAAIFVKEERIGEMGVVHPEVLKQFKWPYPVSMIELNFEKVVALFESKAK